MCFEEFNRLFCKGIFKYALINIIKKLQKLGDIIKKEEGISPQKVNNEFNSKKITLNPDFVKKSKNFESDLITQKLVQKISHKLKEE
jgi:hypothetical protein